MLYFPDVNIIVYASMKGVPEHEAAFAWLHETLEDPNSAILLSEATLLAVLRLTTNKKIFDPPLPIVEALSIISQLLDRTNVSVYQPFAEHFIEVARFMKKHSFGGDLVMDAHLAVTAMATGATLVTRDTDFDDIPYLKTLNPIGSFSDE